MKKNILALAVISAMAAPVAMADKHSTTLYGQINAAVNSTSDKGMKTTDRDSRLGVKGSADLGNGLKGVYKMEFGVKVADSFSGLSGRNATLGLKGNFGTVFIGRDDLPFKKSQPKDLFGDATYADIGKTAMSGGLGVKAGEVRSNNVLGYISPEFNGFKLMVTGVSNLAVDDESTIDENESLTKDSLTNAVSAALSYGSKKKGFYGALAMNSWSSDTKEGNGETFTETRLSAQYAIDGLIATGIYQTFDDGASTDGPKEGSNIQVGVGYKMGNFMPKAKYSMVDYKASNKDDGSAYAIGLDYKLAKATTLYAEYTFSDKDLGANVTGGADKDDPKVNKDLTDFAVGVKHKF